MGTGRGNKTDETAGGKVAMIMAITKIIKEDSRAWKCGGTFEASLAYICNEAKTEKGSLVGGINCCLILLMSR